MRYPEGDMTEGQELERAARLDELKSEYLRRIQTEDPDILAQELAEEKLSDEYKKEQAGLLARKDALTGLDNRLSFDERLPEAVDGAIRTGDTLSVLFIDLDYMKEINDEHGHPATDEVIKAVTTTLRSGLYRSSDGIFRYGGDELAAVLPATQKTDAIKVALRLRQALEELQIVINGQNIAVTSSIGVDSLKPPPDPRLLRRKQSIIPQNAAGLVIGADKAMYAAKARGRNSIGVIVDSDKEKFQIGELFPKQWDIITPIARSASQPKPTLIRR